VYTGLLAISPASQLAGINLLIATVAAVKRRHIVQPRRDAERRRPTEAGDGSRVEQIEEIRSSVAREDLPSVLENVREQGRNAEHLEVPPRRWPARY